MIILKWDIDFSSNAIGVKTLVNRCTSEKEKSGILNMAIAGIKRLQKNRRFTYDDNWKESVIKAREFNESNGNIPEIIGEDFSRLFIFGEDLTTCTPEIWDTYNAYCLFAGVQEMNKKSFQMKLSKYLLSKGCKKNKKAKPVVWKGVRCRLPTEFDDEREAVDLSEIVPDLDSLRNAGM